MKNKIPFINQLGRDRSQFMTKGMELFKGGTKFRTENLGGSIKIWPIGRLQLDMNFLFLVEFVGGPLNSPRLQRS